MEKQEAIEKEREKECEVEMEVERVHEEGNRHLDHLNHQKPSPRRH